ncbi:MAG: cupin domain-containing protein [Bacteroidota bacterium]
MLYSTNPEQEFYTTEGCYIIEIINQPVHAELSIARARVPAGVTTRWHTVDVREVYYLLSGQGHAEVGEEAWDVGPGDAVTIPPGLRQRITNTGSDDLVFLCVCTPRFRPEGYQEV